MDRRSGAAGERRAFALARHRRVCIDNRRLAARHRHDRAGPARLAEVVQARIKIHTIGLGSANGSYVPLEMAGGLNGQVVKYLQGRGGARLVSRGEAKTMREISERTGGGFFRGETDKQVDQAVEDILYGAQPVSGFQSNAVRKDLYTYFLAGAFACLLIGVFL